MTLLSRICFSVALAWPGSAATLSGRVELLDSRSSAVLQRHDYSGVAVWLEPTGAALRPPPLHTRMLQKDKTFAPHLMIVTVGSTVDFPNLDPVFHNAFSNYDGQLFDVGLYPPGTTRSIRFNRPGVVRVFCNIHSSMSAIIAVVNTPLFGITGPDGHFEIGSVPAGEYDLTFFHERATEAVLRRAGRRITVSGDHVTVPPVAISETGYLPIPHKNKYGQDYPPATDPGGFYPATRK